MIKIGDDYLDFNGDVEMERSARILESFSSTSGDFSYSFDISNTAYNRKLLGVESINQTNKPNYLSIEAVLENNEGVGLYYGMIRVDRIPSKAIISCSFFSGNNVWMSYVTGNILDLDYSEWDVEKTQAAITATWTTSTDGVIFPLVDKGTLSNRIGQAIANNTQNLNLAAFELHPFYFVNSIIKKIFSSSGLKISGELLNEFLYKHLTVTSNRGQSRSERVEERTAEVGRLSSQSIPTSETKLELTSNDPFSDGELGNWDNTLFRYTADVGMYLNIDTSLNMSVDQNYTFTLKRNGVTEQTYTFKENDNSTNGLQLASGDYVEIFVTSIGSTANLLTGSSVTFSPLLFDFIYASDYIPDMDKLEFINNVFKIFNVLCTYDPFTKTVETKIFKNIRRESEIDISENVSDFEIDYYALIQNYGRINNFKYEQLDNQYIEDYNKANLTPYGNGTIELQNQYIDAEADILEVSFSLPYTYFNVGFNTPMVRLDYVESERLSDIEFEIDSVTDNGSGMARFNVPGAMPLGLIAGRVVEIFNSTSKVYTGTGVLSVVTGSYFELVNVPFVEDATALFNLMIYSDVPSDNAVIMLSIMTDISDISSYNEYFLSSTSYTELPYGWVDMPKTGRGIDVLKYSLSFSPVNQLNSFQIGLIDNYYSDLRIILFDPVTLIAKCLISEVLYRKITFKEPIRFTSQELNAIFYCNKITGYINSYKPCNLELIKM